MYLVSLAFGGDDGIRTHDPLLAGQVLSQLSYTPILFWGFILSVRPFLLGLDPVGRSLKIEQQARHTHICTLLDLSSVVILLYEYETS